MRQQCLPVGLRGQRRVTHWHPSASPRPDFAWKNWCRVLPLKPSPVFLSPSVLETVFLDAPSQRRWGDFWVLQFSSVSQLCPTSRPHGLQHAGLPCPGACTNCLGACLLELAPTLGAYVHANFCVWGEE